MDPPELHQQPDPHLLGQRTQPHPLFPRVIQAALEKIPRHVLRAEQTEVENRYLLAECLPSRRRVLLAQPVVELIYELSVIQLLLRGRALESLLQLSLEDPRQQDFFALVVPDTVVVAVEHDADLLVDLAPRGQLAETLEAALEAVFLLGAQGYLVRVVVEVLGFAPVVGCLVKSGLAKFDGKEARTSEDTGDHVGLA